MKTLLNAVLFQSNVDKNSLELPVSHGKHYDVYSLQEDVRKTLHRNQGKFERRTMAS